LEDYLTERHKENDRKYGHRYSQLTGMLGKTLARKPTQREELRGLREDKLKLIRSFANFLEEADAA
jgi:hypothetical protein